MFELGTAGIEETPNGLRAYFEDFTDAASIRARFDGRPSVIETDLPVIEVHESEDREPILIGDRFVLVPGNRIVLPIDAAMAFGSGRHETTQLCLEALEKYLKPGDTVYDVGCGSGILSLAALKLGAARVVGVDIDQAAVAVARRHFPGPLFVGSADCFPSRSAHITLCNITGTVNDLLSFDLKRVTHPGGLLILSGFTAQTAPACFAPQEKFNRADWECWICRPDQVTTQSPGTPHSYNLQWWL